MFGWFFFVFVLGCFVRWVWVFLGLGWGFLVGFLGGDKKFVLHGS